MRPCFAILVLALALWTVPNVAQAQSPEPANAQGTMAAAKIHIDKAKAAAYRPGFDLTTLYEWICLAALSDKGPQEPPLELPNRNIPPRSDWYSEPSKVFDNLFWLGSYGDNRRVPQIGGDSTWAVTTSAGIILIDSGYDYSVKVLVTDGLKKLGLDPTQIKYLIISHAHNDRFYGATYIQDTYHPHVIMSDADWKTLAQDNDPEELKPKKDMVATDGMKLTLGDTTLTLYITPGHTPGTISTLIPLKDGNDRHVGVIWGGVNPSLVRHGVRYYASWQESFKTWSASVTRFQGIAAAAGADTYLTLHPFYDNVLEKIHAIAYRRPGDPHPFVNKDNLNRYLTITKECTDAQLARIVPTISHGATGE